MKTQEQLQRQTEEEKAEQKAINRQRKVREDRWAMFDQLHEIAREMADDEGEIDSQQRSDAEARIFDELLCERLRATKQ